MSALRKLDARYIFVLMVCAILFIYYFPIPFPIKITDDTRKYYSVIQGLAAGDVVLLSYDSVARQKATTQPAMTATLKHLLARDAKLVIVSLQPEGPILAHQALEESGWTKKTYGKDYALLGWLPGAAAGVETLAADIHKPFTTDFYGNSVDELPMMANIKSYRDLKLMINVGAVEPGIQIWATIFAPAYPVTYIFYDLRAHIPNSMPYLTAGIAKAFLMGELAAGEYEMLLGKPGAALGTIATQDVLVLMLFIAVILCNIIYYATPHERGK